MNEDNYQRFTRVVDHYSRHRPRYPQDLITLLQTDCGLTPEHIIADIGCGTGLLADLFLHNGNRVFGVEPNLEMRGAAETLLRAYPGFTAVDGTAEATTLAPQSVHMITAGQAFQWFDPAPTRAEFERILTPGGWVVLVWNMFAKDGTMFSDAFADFWQKHINPRENFGERRPPDNITSFFTPGHFKEVVLQNQQVCDREALQGRVLSSSTSPQVGDATYQPMMEALAAIFDQYQDGNTVTITYYTPVIIGQFTAR